MLEFLGRELEHEIGREALAVALTAWLSARVCTP
jgi:hypothetical protein